MEDKKTHFDLFTMVSLGGYLFLMILFSLSKIAAVIFCSACVVFFLVYSVFRWIPPKIEILEHRICKRLDGQGYQYEKKEGNLYVTKSNSHFEVQLGESLNRRVKHLFIYYKFKDNAFERVNLDGWSRASNILNVRNTNTVFVVLEDHLCCCYQSAIGNSKDFMDEFDIAYQSIGEVMEDYGKLVPLLERDYPSNMENQVAIGFNKTNCN
jgi:hypothetical protein